MVYMVPVDKFNVLVKQAKNGGVNDWGVAC